MCQTNLESFQALQPGALSLWSFKGGTRYMGSGCRFRPTYGRLKCVPQSQPYAVSGIQSEYRCRPWHAGSTGEDQFPRKRMLNGCEVVPPEWE